jgi:hypothetical protein
MAQNGQPCRHAPRKASHSTKPMHPAPCRSPPRSPPSHLRSLCHGLRLAPTAYVRVTATTTNAARARRHRQTPSPCGHRIRSRQMPDLCPLASFAVETRRRRWSALRGAPPSRNLRANGTGEEVARGSSSPLRRQRDGKEREVARLSAPRATCIGSRRETVFSFFLPQERTFDYRSSLIL